MKIVIFGATGNVGRPLVKEALSRGHQVVGVVRDPQAVQSPDARVIVIRAEGKGFCAGVDIKELDKHPEKIGDVNLGNARTCLVTAGLGSTPTSAAILAT